MTRVFGMPVLKGKSNCMRFKMSKEITRIREKGTIVTMPNTGLERIQSIRAIVTSKRYAKVDNCMIDLFSANAIIQVYDAINPKNQVKLRNMIAPQMAHVAFKVINKATK